MLGVNLQNELSNGHEFEIRTDNLVPGIYIVHASDKNGKSTTRKIIKK